MADRPMTTPIDDSVLERMVLDLEGVVELSEASLCKYFDLLLAKKEPSLPSWLRPPSSNEIVSAAFKSLVKSLKLMPQNRVKSSLTREELFPSVFKKKASENTAEPEGDEIIRKARKRHTDKRSGDSKEKRSKSKHH